MTIRKIRAARATLAECDQRRLLAGSDRSSKVVVRESPVRRDGCVTAEAGAPSTVRSSWVRRTGSAHHIFLESGCLSWRACPACDRICCAIPASLCPRQLATLAGAVVSRSRHTPAPVRARPGRLV